MPSMSPTCTPEPPQTRSPRRRRRALGSVVCGLFLLAGSGAAAGPWVHELGHAYIKVSGNYFSAEESFNRGVVATGLQFESFTYRLYSEIGLPARFQLTLDLPYTVATNISSADIEFNNNTFGDVRARLDYRLFEDIPLALGVEIKVPAYESVDEQGTGGVVDIDGTIWPTASFPEVGDGNVDLTGLVMWGHSFYPFPAWVTADVGYQHRFEGFSDGLYVAAGGGVFVWPEHIAIGVHSNGVFTLEEDEDPATQASKEYLYLQGYLLVTAAPWQPQLGLTLSAGGLVHTENAAPGMDFGLGVSYEF